MNNDFCPLVRWFANDFHSCLRHSWKSLANHHTCDQKSLFTVTHASLFIYPSGLFHWHWVNSMWSCSAIWRQTSESTLVQVMAWWCQATTNIDLLSNVLCGINLTPFSLPLTKLLLSITVLMSFLDKLLHFPWHNELILWLNPLRFFQALSHVVVVYQSAVVTHVSLISFDCPFSNIVKSIDFFSDPSAAARFHSNPVLPDCRGGGTLNG